ncbi:MAG: twitching motility protein PilT [Cellulosilyticaceae bacterium]
MIQIITGQTGEGKTKQMIDAANEQAKNLKGHVVYIDSTTHHRYALSHHIRLIEATSFPISSPNDLISFLCGVLSANHDTELVFVDELLKLTRSGLDDLSYFFDKLKHLSEQYTVNFVVGMSCASKDVPEKLNAYLIA